ncbi:MAG: alpha/beta fold hydrolase [Phycisphaerae bacterium]|nr:alpha/beta fold hydrolase [Phycisphaerae bacterium]
MANRTLTRRAARGRLAGFVAIGSVIAFPLLNRLTCHPGETVILLLPLAFGAMLWFGWPAVRRVAWWKYALYVGFLVLIVAGAEAFAAYVARGRLLWIEVVWAIYFIIAWRMAWGLWKRTVGVAGERYRRWGRRARRRAGGLRQLSGARWRMATAALFIGPARFCLVVFVFAPLLLGSLIHRIKIGNSADFGGYASLPIETVSFPTEDGLTISGWFLPDGNSDSTVVICHGAGANKGNFVDFLGVFHTRGYNALIFDFRGHGESSGHTSTFGLFETADVRAAVDWLKNERPRQAQHVYALGSSMGAMALVRAAANDPRIEAIILDSAYVSAPLLARQHTAGIPVIGRAFSDLILAAMSLHAGRSMWSLDASDAIAALSPRPVLLIHGEDDLVIPPVNLSLLFDLANEPKTQWLGPGMHSNIMFADFDGYQQRVITFLDQAKSAQAATQ